MTYSNYWDSIPESLQVLYHQCGTALKNFADLETEFPEDTLYHYTNFSGLKGILETKSLWLTEYRHLNDTSEVTYASNKIIDITRNHYSQTYGKFWAVFFTNFDMLLKEHCNIYLASFCKKPDYLPAWRGYAEDAAGFAIGFRKEYFIPTSNKEPEEEFPKQLLKIHYKTDFFEPFVKNLISMVETELNKIIQKKILK